MRAVPLASLLVLLAACGGSGERLSKASFDARADAVCRKYTAKIATVPPPKNLTQVSPYVDIVEPYLERGIDEIAHLRPPLRLQGLYERWLDSQRQGLKDADALRTAAEKNDLAGVNAQIEKINEHNRRGVALAGRLGAALCARR
jgi:hypothetical protein